MRGRIRQSISAAYSSTRGLLRRGATVLPCMRGTLAKVAIQHSRYRHTLVEGSNECRRVELHTRLALAAERGILFHQSCRDIILLP